VATLAQTPDDSDGGRPLDIIVFVADQRSSPAALDGFIDRMLGDLNWGAVTTQISVIIPDNVEPEHKSDSPIRFIRASAATSAFRQRCRVLESAPRDLLISFGEYLPPIGAIGRLQAASRDDEMVSAVVPRVALGPNDELMALGSREAPNMLGMLDAKYASALAPAYYFPEILCPCMLIPGRMVGNIDLPEEFDHFPDLILAFLRAGRRRGLLVRIDNRIIVSSKAKFDPAALCQETAKMLQLFNDYQMVERRVAANPAYSDERRFRVLRRSSPGVRGSLLLDCTNVPPAHSGSAEYTLGVLAGFATMNDPAWEITAMLMDDARAYFSIDERFPKIRIASPSDEAFYDCAIRLSQAWSISNVRDLDRRARSIAVTILDTIGPDVIYAVPETAEEAFQFAAEHADGLMYISEFSRNQFRRRFVTRPNIVEAVVYLSLEPSEYEADRSLSDGQWILIFGNAYDHKDLERTTKIVSAAFPFEKIKVVGRQQLNGMNVEAFDSGALESEFIDELFARAKCVVFPSFYEGFGLPLVRGLARGKTVIGRHGALVQEILAKLPNSARFVGFDNSLELVATLGKLLHGEGKAPSLPQDTSVEDRPRHDWASCAAQILKFAQEMKSAEDVELWRRRDRAFRYLVSAR
jgi:hypothetical protein